MKMKNDPIKCWQCTFLQTSICCNLILGTKKPPQTPSRTVVYYQRGEYGNVALIPAPLKWSNMSGIIGQCANFGIYYYQ